VIRPNPTVLLAPILCLAACKGDPDPSQAQGPVKPDLGPEAAAATAEVPEGLKDKLEFVAREIDDGEVLAVVPKDWPESEYIPGSFLPPGAEFGHAVGFSVGTNCDGVCSPKDWKAVVEKVEFGGYQPPAFTVETDEPIGEHGRLVVYVGGDEVHIRAAWWKPEAKRYANCRADLDATWSPAKAAFIRACKATVLVDWGL